MKKQFLLLLTGLGLFMTIGCGGGGGGGRGPRPIDQDVVVGPKAPCYFSELSDDQIHYTLKKALKVMPSAPGTTTAIDDHTEYQAMLASTFVLSAFAVSVPEDLMRKIIVAGQLPIAIMWATDRYRSSFLEPSPEIVQNIKTCKGK